MKIGSIGVENGGRKWLWGWFGLWRVKADSLGVHRQTEEPLRPLPMSTPFPSSIL